MKATSVVKRLVRLLEASPSLLVLAEDVDKSDAAEQLAADVVDWSNMVDFEKGDVQRLWGLLRERRFRSWTCPTCTSEDRVYWGNPEDWGVFQGTKQADYVTFPGYGISTDDRRCDLCRKLGEGDATYVPEGYELRLQRGINIRKHP